MTPEERKKVARAAIPQAVDRAARFVAAGATAASDVEFILREIEQSVMDAESGGKVGGQGHAGDRKRR